ncbi:MAG: hypothetical protein R6X16_08610 [Anaerolineae bacterium]
MQKHSLGAWLRRLMSVGPAVGGLPAALSLEQEAYVLAHAYVPEHIPSLMTGISGAHVNVGH